LGGQRRRRHQRGTHRCSTRSCAAAAAACSARTQPCPADRPQPAQASSSSTSSVSRSECWLAAPWRGVRVGGAVWLAIDVGRRPGLERSRSRSRPQSHPMPLPLHSAGAAHEIPVGTHPPHMRKVTDHIVHDAAGVTDSTDSDSVRRRRRRRSSCSSLVLDQRSVAVCTAWLGTAARCGGGTRSSSRFAGRQLMHADHGSRCHRHRHHLPKEKQ
jgi:hypothetical protein